MIYTTNLIKYKGKKLISSYKRNVKMSAKSLKYITFDNTGN